MVTTQIIVVRLAVLPAFIVFAAVYVWFTIQTRQTRVPVKEKLLRSPGESLRRSNPPLRTDYLAGN
jgi:hypothetical protein